MVATIGERQEESRMVGIGRYVLNPQTNMAEVALLVADDFQGRGLGTSMLEGLSQAAKSHGIAGFVADVMVENKAMLTLFHRAFKNVESSLTDNVYSLVMYFD